MLRRDPRTGDPVPCADGSRRAGNHPRGVDAPAGDLHHAADPDVDSRRALLRHRAQPRGQLAPGTRHREARVRGRAHVPRRCRRDHAHRLGRHPAARRAGERLRNQGARLHRRPHEGQRTVRLPRDEVPHRRPHPRSRRRRRREQGLRAVGHCDHDHEERADDGRGDDHDHRPHVLHAAGGADVARSLLLALLGADREAAALDLRATSARSSAATSPATSSSASSRESARGSCCGSWTCRSRWRSACSSPC